MLTYLIKVLIHKYIPKNTPYAEDIIRGGKEGLEAQIAISQKCTDNSLYPLCRDLFKGALQNKRLNRLQLLYIKETVTGFLGEYKRYYNQRYKNDAHEIYSKLKSPFLCNVDYQTLINIIERMSDNAESN
ncbi:MAG: hypothetical protein Q8920_16150 [Bacillota bacterium]|nr:hypothetical protein [Bacillota bacterium]